MNKRFVSMFLLIIFMGVCLTIFCSCGEKEIVERAVVLELINPNTGEVIKDGDRIGLPTERTYVEVRIKDKETGVYLTDDDLPENTIKGSYHVGFSVVETGNPIYTSGYWPLVSELDAVYDYYKVSIFFECKPRNLVDSKFQRKYKTISHSERIYFI